MMRSGFQVVLKSTCMIGWANAKYCQAHSHIHLPRAVMQEQHQTNAVIKLTNNELQAVYVEFIPWIHAYSPTLTESVMHIRVQQLCCALVAGEGVRGGCVLVRFQCHLY